MPARSLRDRRAKADRNVVIRSTILRLWIAQQLLVECGLREPDAARSAEIRERARIWTRRAGAIEDRAYRELGLDRVLADPTAACRRLVRAVTGLRFAFSTHRTPSALARDVERSLREIFRLAEASLEAATPSRSPAGRAP